MADFDLEAAAEAAWRSDSGAQTGWQRISDSARERYRAMVRAAHRYGTPPTPPLQGPGLPTVDEWDCLLAIVSKAVALDGGKPGGEVRASALEKLRALAQGDSDFAAVVRATGQVAVEQEARAEEAERRLEEGPGLTRDEMQHLLARCTESTNTPKVNGYSCEVCRAIGEKLERALASPEEGKPEERQRHAEQERNETEETLIRVRKKAEQDRIAGERRIEGLVAQVAALEEAGRR
jgi:hypothetical protein